MKDGAQDDDDDDEEDEDEQRQQRNIDFKNAESKFAKEAIQKMQEQEEEDQANQQQEDDNGGGIRLGNRRGKKQSKGGVDRSNLHKKVITNKPSAPGSGVLIGTYDEKDIEFLRNAVQSLCQSTNPLGKSIDFVTEDIDSMVSEFKHWRSEYNNSK